MTEPVEKWTGPDKTLHFIMIGGVPAFIGTLMTGNPFIGAGVGVGLGALKEALDATNNGTVSWKDFLVTCAGAVTGGFLGFLAQYLMV